MRRIGENRDAGFLGEVKKLRRENRRIDTTFG